MTQEQKFNFAQKIYNEAHSKIFSESEFADFYATVIDPPAVATKVLVYECQKEITGYASFQLYEIGCGNGSIYVAMSEMGLTKPDKSIGVHPTEFVLLEFIKVLIKKPFAKLFMVDTLISPQIYKRVCEMAYKVYPTFNNSISEKHQHLACKVAEYFSWDIQYYKESVVRTLNWKVNKNYSAVCLNKRNKDLIFYLEVVPDFSKGKGLVIVMPFTLKNAICTVAKSALLFLKHKLKKRTNGVFGPAIHNLTRRLSYATA